MADNIVFDTQETQIIEFCADRLCAPPKVCVIKKLDIIKHNKVILYKQATQLEHNNCILLHNMERTTLGNTNTIGSAYRMPTLNTILGNGTHTIRHAKPYDNLRHFGQQKLCSKNYISTRCHALQHTLHGPLTVKNIVYPIPYNTTQYQF